MKMTPHEQAEALRKESKELLHSLFQVPAGYGNESIDRFVDCMISAAILGTVTVMTEAAENMDET